MKNKDYVVYEFEASLILDSPPTELSKRRCQISCASHSREELIILELLTSIILYLRLHEVGETLRTKDHHDDVPESVMSQCFT